MLYVAWFCAVLVCSLVTGQKIARFVEENVKVIPIQLNTQADEVVIASMEVDVFGSDIEAITRAFCEEHNVTSSFCNLLYNHIYSIILDERKVLGAPRPARSEFRHESAITAESVRFTNPELFINFTDITNNENSVVELLKMEWTGRPIRKLTFLHSCQLSDNKDTRVLEGLLRTVSDSGLGDTVDGIVVLNYGYAVDQEVKDRFSDKIVWFQVHHDVRYFEVPSLRIMHRLVKHLQHIQPEINPQVLYLHTKGVSYKELSTPVQDWINVMMYFLVERHATCTSLLQSGEIDTVGILYRNSPDYFCGNFWWASGSYLAARPELKYEESVKYEAEYWLLRDSEARMFVLHNNIIDHYTVPYPRYCYAPDAQNSSTVFTDTCGPHLKTRKYVELSYVHNG